MKRLDKRIRRGDYVLVLSGANRGIVTRVVDVTIPVLQILDKRTGFLGTSHIGIKRVTLLARNAQEPLHV